MTNSVEIEPVYDDDSYGDELPPGTMLCGGQYEIESYLNSGGFGITYVARDSLKRRVVVKECFPGALCCRASDTVRLRSRGSTPEFEKILELFEKEARALAELHHPNIVGVHQIFNENDTVYMALDYVQGNDLLHVIENERHRLNPPLVKRLLKQMLDAIAYLHDRDILHRDISPDNILLEDDDTPVLIDFGAAREDATRVSRALSKVLTVKDGYSPQEFYLAGSEQAYSSDLYALAATFYHLVSGTPPPSSQERLAAAAKKMPDPLEPLGSAYHAYDPFVIESINQCLSIFPAERIQSAAEWLDVIDTARRRRVLAEKAKRDADMESRISQLVEASRVEPDPEPAAAGAPLSNGHAEPAGQPAAPAASAPNMAPVGGDAPVAPDHAAETAQDADPAQTSPQDTEQRKPRFFGALRGLRIGFSKEVSK